MDRKEHLDTISDNYIPRLGNPEVLEELAGLPLEELCIISGRATYALREGMFHGVNPETLKKREPAAVRFSDSISAINKMIAERITTEQDIYVLVDNNTGTPLVNNHGLYIFLKKADAASVADRLLQQFRQTNVVKIEKENLVQFFADMIYSKGIDRFSIYGDLEYQPRDCFVEGKDIVTPPDYKDIPAISRPVRNPKFCRALIELEQERRWKWNYEGKANILRDLEGEMIRTFCTAKFLVPMKLSSEPENGVLKEKTKIRFPFLEDGNGNKLLPVFTDWNEFSKLYSKDEWSGNIRRSCNLSFVDYDSAVINAGTLGFNVNKKMLKAVFDSYMREFFPPSKVVNTHIQRRALNGAKTPHSTSFPVIRLIDEEYRLAAFTFFFTKEDIESGECERPTVVTVADIEGNVIDEYQTKDNEFSEAPYDKKYNVRYEGEIAKDHYDKALKILDEVRESIIRTGSFDKERYQEYLDMILATIPKEYRQFYEDLSR